MSVLDRAALEESPLADLHEIASELSIDGYRRLRRAQLIGAILTKQSGPEEADRDSEDAPAGAVQDRDHEPAVPADDEEHPESAQDDLPAESAAVPERDGEAAASASEEDDDRGHAAAAGGEERDGEATEGSASAAEADDEEVPAPRRRRGRRGGRGRSGAREEAPRDEDQVEPELAQTPAESAESPPEPAETPTEDQLVEGVVELLPNGSGFVRVEPPEPSDDDVYISAAQVKRCELVTGDRVLGPKRTPRRSERFASMIRIDSINGRPAAELADSVRFDDLPAAFPDDRFRLGSEDPTVKAIEWLTPFGKGSRVTIVGPARSGKTEALSRLASSLSGHDELALTVVLAGVRPEEISAWSQGPLAPAVGLSFATSPDAQGSAIEPVIDQARRLAARGADAVVLIDTLDGLPTQVARRLLASARNIVDGGSLTVIATASAPIGGETTVIALDASLASTARFPAVDLVASGTIHPELLVGEAGAEAIARARAEALDD
jgi:transcription termination factor Rho